MDSQTESTDLRDRMEELRATIREHNYHYFVQNEPIVSDYEYDQLMKELREIEEAHPDWVTPDSPTQRAGASPADRFEKVRHPASILSLNNAFDANDVRAWYQRILRLDDRVADADFVVEPKIDGLTVVLHYEDGRFVLGATRGDGFLGEDITRNLRTIRSIPLRIPASRDGPNAPASLVVRGEVYMTIADFEKLNKRLEENGERTYLNPRNTASGALRQLDPKITASRPLLLLTYSIVDGQDSLPDTQWKTLEYLREMGFPVSEHVFHCEDLESVIRVCEEWEEKRADFPYEADGMVIKINDLRLQRDLGVVGKDPRGAIAYKFPAEEVTTRLLNIGANVGRTGVLTPYAVLEPVNIGGVIVKQATLHNFDYIKEKDIRIGDRVRVKRAGEVIPYVIGPIEAARDGSEREYVPPEVCPACGEEVENLPGEVAWYCVNAACPEQLVRNLEHFVSRGAMDIVGLGIKLVDQLVREGMVRDVADLYFLDREQLLRLERYGEKKVDNILRSLEASKERSLARLVTALGIRGVGSITAADLARHFSDLDDLATASMEDLQGIEGIGPNVARSIVDWFERPANRQVLEKLKNTGVWPISEAVREKGPRPFDGLTFVVTGTLPEMTREDARSFITERGGKVSGSVSGKTDYLVVGDNPGSKFDKAQALNVAILDEAGLRTLASERGS